MELLSGYEKSSLVGQRAKTLRERLKLVLNNVPGSTPINLVWYCIWGQPLGVRILTLHDNFEFNRIPKGDHTRNMPLEFTDTQENYALGFCLSQLGKPYDRVKALFYWMPRPWASDAIPPKMFCSEFVVVMFHALGLWQDQQPERICPNKLYSLLNS